MAKARPGIPDDVDDDLTAAPGRATPAPPPHELPTGTDKPKRARKTTAAKEAAAEGSKSETVSKTTGAATEATQATDATTGETASDAAADPAAPGKIGIKAATTSMTVYMHPDDHLRLRVLVAQLRTNANEVFLRGLDKIFEEHGQPPCRRYQPPKKGK